MKRGPTDEDNQGHPPAVLEARAVSKSYAPGSFALHPASLTVTRGEFIAVVGPSGAGKSTMLRCFNRLVDPTAGAILLDGADVTRVSGRRLRDLRTNVAMIFQQFNLVSRLTVLENVLVGRLRFTAGSVWGPLAIFRIFSPAQRLAAMACLEEVGIAHFAHRRADELSGGQQQRVAIARALAQEPLVMLADEPVASLDPASSTAVMTALKDICERRGTPVIVNLHQVDLAKEYATRIIGLRDGRLVFDGPPDAFDNDELHRLYFEGPPPTASVEPHPDHRGSDATQLRGTSAQLEVRV